jgi:hypothetical protein
MSDHDSPSSAPSPALVLALRRVLRPLVKLMLSRGITFTYLSELLKSLFVEVADRDFRIENSVPTDSRVSLISGIHRKEVSRLRLEQRTDDAAVPTVVSLGAQLVAVWLGSAPYLDEDGQPRPLARFAKDGGPISFEALVAGVNSDIRPRVVLDEWMRLGRVQLDTEQRVHLNVKAFIPAQGFEDKAFYLGHNLRDHALAATHNLLSESKPFMERSVHYDELSAESITELAQLSERLGMEALIAVNKRAMELEKADAVSQAPPSPAQRMTLGVYFYAEAASVAGGGLKKNESRESA